MCQCALRVCLCVRVCGSVLSLEVDQLSLHRLSQAKGLEFDRVYLADDLAFPNDLLDGTQVVGEPTVVDDDRPRKPEVDTHMQTHHTKELRTKRRRTNRTPSPSTHPPLCAGGGKAALRNRRMQPYLCTSIAHHSGVVRTHTDFLV